MLYRRAGRRRIGARDGWGLQDARETWGSPSVYNFCITPPDLAMARSVIAAYE